MCTSDGKTDPLAISSSEVIWERATAARYSIESGMLSAAQTSRYGRGGEKG
jgi:hypothetical protein